MAKNQELKNLLNQIKYEKDLTQAEIAQLVGIGKTYMSDMLNGRVPFTAKMMEKLEKLLEYNTVIVNENIDNSNIGNIDDSKISTDVLKSEITRLNVIITEKENQVSTLINQVTNLTNSLSKKDDQISKLIDKIK